jgi:hypothetical protein
MGGIFIVDDMEDIRFSLAIYFLHKFNKVLNKGHRATQLQENQ